MSTQRGAKRETRKRAGGELAPIEFVAVARFIGVSLAFLVAACACLNWPAFTENIVARYCDFIAGTVRFALNLAGMHAHGDGPYIVVRNYSMLIITGCTGLDISAVVIGAIIGFPALWKSKLTGCASILAAIAVLNLVRVGVLVVIGSRMGKGFEDVHVIYAQGMIILFAVGLWVLWVTRSSTYALQRGHRLYH